MAEPFFQLRINTLTDSVLEMGKWPFPTDSVMGLKINLKQIAETTQKFVHYKYLKADKIYRNPRGI